MVARRLLYLAVLLACFLFYIFHTVYLSWLLLILVLLLPVFSGLLSLLFLSQYKVTPRWNSHEIQQGDAPMLYLEVGAGSPITPLSIKLSFENLLTGSSIEKKIQTGIGIKDIPAVVLQQCECGVLRCSIKKARMTDLLGLIYFPIKHDRYAHILVLPEKTEYVAGSLGGRSLKSLVQQDVNNAKMRGLGDREQKGVKEYKPGDPIRDIHWKLTARSRKLQVKEFERDGSQTVQVRLEPTGETGQRIQQVSRLMGLADYLTDQQQPFLLSLPGSAQQGNMQPEGYSYDGQDFDEFLWQLLSLPPDFEREQDGGPAKNLTFVVEAEETKLYIDGVEVNE